VALITASAVCRTKPAVIRRRLSGLEANAGEFVATLVFLLSPSSSDFENV